MTGSRGGLTSRCSPVAPLVVALLLATVSFDHVVTGGQAWPRRISQGFYLLLGGRWLPTSENQQGRVADPLRAAVERENERLSSLLALDGRLTGERRAARVVRREPDRWWSELEIEFPILGPAPPRGTALVLTPQGLIGTLESERFVLGEVQGVRVARGTVSLLSGAGHQLSVMVGPDEQPFLLEGRGGPGLALRPVSGAAEKSVMMGDPVVTSGLGNLYRSRGLPIAQVEEDVHWARFSALASTPSEVVLWWR